MNFTVYYDFFFSRHIEGDIHCHYYIILFLKLWSLLHSMINICIIIKYVYVKMFKTSCCQYHIIPRMLQNNYISLYVVILVTIIIFSLPGHQSVLLSMSINTYISELPVQDMFSINMEKIFQRPVSFFFSFFHVALQTWKCKVKKHSWVKPTNKGWFLDNKHFGIENFLCKFDFFRV